MHQKRINKEKQLRYYLAIRNSHDLQHTFQYHTVIDVMTDYHVSVHTWFPLNGEQFRDN